MMNFRLARPSALVDIGRIPGLSYVRMDGEVLTVGALTTHGQVERVQDAAICQAFPVLPSAARLIGHEPIRVRGTFGGSLAHADPTAEWCLLAVLLDAEMVATGLNGTRAIPAAEFFRGYYTTALSFDEILVEARFALAAAAASLEIEDGVCRSARIALGASRPPRFAPRRRSARSPESRRTRTPLRRQPTWRRGAVDPASDVHGSASTGGTFAR